MQKSHVKGHNMKSVLKLLMIQSHENFRVVIEHWQLLQVDDHWLWKLQIFIISLYFHYKNGHNADILQFSTNLNYLPFSIPSSETNLIILK